MGKADHHDVRSVVLWRLAVIVLKRKETGGTVEQIADAFRPAVRQRGHDEEAAMSNRARRQDEAGSDLMFFESEFRHGR
jgi:hypothetical protein